jgi:hypothetical protein
VLAVLLALAGVTFVVAATPVVTGRPLSSAVGPILVGTAAMAAAAALSWKAIRGVYCSYREVRRGIRQIEMVLELEAALSARRVTVAGSNAGCPICGAPAGPHCVCRKES